MHSLKKLALFSVSLLFIFCFMYFSFQSTSIFWYMYTFTMLIGMIICYTNSIIHDHIPTVKYFALGIVAGFICYVVSLGVYILLPIELQIDVLTFIDRFGPQNIWQYILLILFISVSEELYWRGYVQQFIHQYANETISIITTSILFSLSLLVSGFWLGAIAAFFTSLLFGWLYEKGKSMPLIIVAHITLITLLFLLLPLH